MNIAVRIAEQFWDDLLGNVRWYRRVSGGHWERWLIRGEHPDAEDVTVYRDEWRHVGHCTCLGAQKRPLNAVQGPFCEHH